MVQQAFFHQDWKVLPGPLSVMAPGQMVFCLPLFHRLQLHQSIRACSEDVHLCIMYPKYLRFSLIVSASIEQPNVTSSGVEWLIGSSGCPSFCQQFSPVPKFKSIHLFLLSLSDDPAFMSQLSRPWAWQYVPWLSMWCLNSLTFCVDFC